MLQKSGAARAKGSLSILQRERGMGLSVGGLEETLAPLRVTFTEALLHDNMF